MKLLLTSGALYFVFTKIDFKEFYQTIRSAKIHYFLLGVLGFNISKIISAFRLYHFYSAIKVKLSHRFNLKLYYVGMFYNLFLPGSIGGDGYKVYLLRQNKEASTKNLVSATVLDRLSGLIWLFILGCILFGFSSYGKSMENVWLYVLLMTVLVIPVSYFAVKLLFPVFQPKFVITSHLSFWVQFFQVVCAWCILQALDVHTHYIDYLTLFMASSVVAVLPFTIGGVGARELVFLYGYQYLEIEKPTAIAFTILFFASTAITALLGIFYSYKIDQSNSGSLPEETLSSK